MEDQSGINQELLEEMSTLKQRIKKLEQSENERLRVEQALKESETLLQTYMENAPDAIYTSDMKGTFLYGNRKSEEIIGYSRDELIGKSYLELNVLSEKSLNKAIELLQTSMEGKPTGPDEIELINKEGHLYLLRSTPAWSKAWVKNYSCFYSRHYRKENCRRKT